MPGTFAAAPVDPALSGYPAGGVRLLDEGQATRDAIRAALAELARASGPQSTVFLSFSGHGGRIPTGPDQGQYLLPVDAVYPTDDDLARTASSGAGFTAALDAIKAQRLTVVLDCCNAGGLGEPRHLGAAVGLEPGLSDGDLTLPRSNRVPSAPNGQKASWANEDTTQPCDH